MDAQEKACDINQSFQEESYKNKVQAVDSICLYGFKGEPHGNAPFVTYNNQGSPIDTTIPGNKN